MVARAARLAHELRINRPGGCAPATLAGTRTPEDRPLMSVVWIVQRDPTERAALARLAGVSESATIGAPGDAVFRDAPAPDVVVLGLAGDLEVELEFVHRTSAAARTARWILVGDRTQLGLARQLFDILPASFWEHPPTARALREAIGSTTPTAQARPLPLSQRPARDALAERFARAFADLDPPALLRAIDPRLSEVPLLLLGEAGSGCATLARYIHHFGGTAGGAFVELPCSHETRPSDLLQRIAGARDTPGADIAVSLWLADPSRLSGDAQHVVQGWIEYGLPPSTAAARRVRWVASDQGGAIEPGLLRALAGLTVHVPPLREHPEHIANLVAATAESWCRSRGVPVRRFGEHALAVLEEYPWPGNLRELEAVVEQSLATSGADPVGPEDLLLDGEPLAPLDFEAPVASPRFATRSTPAVETASPPEQADVESLLDAIGPYEASETETTDVEPHTPNLHQLAAAVGHELRGPLAAIRSFAERLPEQHADAEFRGEFSKRVGENVVRSENIVSQLEHLAELEALAPEPVDVSALLEELLEKRREAIRARRLVVLEELDPARSRAYCDPHQLRACLEAVLDKALALVPERGDAYLASRRLEPGANSQARVRVLLRYRAPQSREASSGRAVASSANALDFAVADLLVRAQGGSLTLDASDRGETILLLDLPAPA